MSKYAGGYFLVSVLVRFLRRESSTGGGGGTIYERRVSPKAPILVVPLHLCKLMVCLERGTPTLLEKKLILS